MAKSTKATPPAGIIVAKKIDIVIEKMKIKNDHLTVTFHRPEADSTTTIGSESRKSIVHADLKTALQACRIHLGLLCDFISTKQLKDINEYNPDIVERFHVTAISISGSEDDQGVTLTGHKIIEKNGKALILNSPYTRFEENPETAYKYIEDLRTCVNDVMSEVRQYMDGSKLGEEVQGKLDLPDPEDE